MTMTFRSEWQAAQCQGSHVWDVFDERGVLLIGSAGRSAKESEAIARAVATLPVFVRCCRALIDDARQGVVPLAEREALEFALSACSGLAEMLR